jgi:hypothetical protein
MWPVRPLDIPVLRAFRDPRVRTAAAAIVLAGAAVRFSVSLLEAFANMSDFRVVMIPNALLAWHGVNPYHDIPLSPSGVFAGPLQGSVYTPTFLMLMWPWTVLPDVVSRLAWMVGEIACLGAVALVAGRSLGGLTRTQWLLCAALLMLFPPVRDNLNEGQVGILLGLLVVLTVAAMEGGRPRFAGVFLGIAVAVKLTPILLLPYFAWRRQWALVASSLVAAGVLFLLTLVIGWGGYWPLFIHSLGEIGQGTAHVLNQSLNGVLLRAYDARTNGYPIPPPSLAVRAVLLLAQALVVLALAAFVLGGRLPRREQVWADAAILLLALPLLQPFAWPHHFAQAAVVIPVAVVLGARARLAPGAIAVSALAYLAVLLFAFPLFVAARHDLTGVAVADDPLLSAGASLLFYAVVATCMAWTWIRGCDQAE